MGPPGIFVSRPWDFLPEKGVRALHFFDLRAKMIKSKLYVFSERGKMACFVDYPGRFCACCWYSLWR